MVVSFMTIPIMILFRKLGSIQHYTGLAITGAIRETSKEKFRQELGFKSLQERHWYRKFYYFYKIF